MKTLTNAIIEAQERLTVHPPHQGALADAEARDWAAFFEAISKFLAALLPMILPLFTDKEKK